jgi:hypothetical protein
MAAIQDPKIQQLMQMNPMAQQIMSAAMAHINEHMAFEYRLQVEKTMGMPLPPIAEDGRKEDRIPPELADRIAIMAAQASQQLLQQNQQEAQQQQAQQQMQDPVVQMQMQELQIKQGELQLKQQKQAMEAAAKADQIRVEEARIAAQKEIAAMQVAANAAAAKDKLDRQSEMEGTRMGIDAAKHKAQMAVQQAAQRSAQNISQKPKKD